MNKIKNTTGSPVEGKDFFGRAKEIEEVIERLEDGNNIILAAPRRVGKTSFVRKLKAVMIKKGWQSFEIDLQKAPSELHFMRLFLKEVKGEKWFEKLFSEGIKLSFKDFTLEINKQRNDFYQKIDAVLDHKEKTLIIFDEFIIFLDDVLRKKGTENEFENVIYFLNWLRGLRLVSGSKIRWIFCSSISIDSYLRKHELLKRNNDLVRYNKIGELKNKEPQLLVKALADSKGIKISDEHAMYILEKIGWKLPYFIQLLFSKIYDLIRDGQVLSNETIDEAYKNLLKEETYFDTWTERLSYYEDDKRFAKLILKELSKSEGGKEKSFLEDLVYAELSNKEKTDEILHCLLNQLETDGYIMKDHSKYIFRSPLLRDYWKNQFGD